MIFRALAILLALTHLTLSLLPPYNWENVALFIGFIFLMWYALGEPPHPLTSIKKGRKHV